MTIILILMICSSVYSFLTVVAIKEIVAKVVEAEVVTCVVGTVVVVVTSIRSRKDTIFA